MGWTEKVVGAAGVLISLGGAGVIGYLPTLYPDLGPYVVAGGSVLVLAGFVLLGWAVFHRDKAKQPGPPPAINMGDKAVFDNRGSLETSGRGSALDMSGSAQFIQGGTMKHNQTDDPITTLKADFFVINPTDNPPPPSPRGREE